MDLHLKSVCAVVWNLNGARSGLRTGMKLNIAASVVERINEADYLSAI